MFALALASKVVIFLMAASVALWALIALRRNPRVTLNLLGFDPVRLPRQLPMGLALGFLSMLLIAFTNWVFGAIEFTSYSGLDRTMARVIGLIVVVSFVEEIVFRSLTLTGLRMATRSDRLSILLMSLLFGFYHANNPDASFLSIVGNGAGGAMYACAFLWSRSIWLPAGLHIGWNVFQGPLWGFPVSGLDFGGFLVQQHTDRVPIEVLSGGEYGPEASLLGVLMRLLIILLLWTSLKPASARHSHIPSFASSEPREPAKRPLTHPPTGPPDPPARDRAALRGWRRFLRGGGRRA